MDSHATGITLRDLPTELLVKVLLHLDGYSLNSVLEAVPEVCRRCVLITDRPKRAMFVAPGLRVVQLSDLETTPTAQFIKLYEIEDTDQALVNTFGTDRLRSTPFYRSLGSFSFVHFATPHSGMPRVCHLIHEVYLTGATAEISHCPVGRIITGSGSTVDFESQLSNDDTSIILKGFTNVQNFKAPENLQSLTVVFGNCGDETPSLHGIEFLHALPLHVKIVYYGRFPEMFDLNFGTGKRGLKRSGSVFELVHAPSMKTHIEGVLTRKPGYNSISARTKELFHDRKYYPENFDYTSSCPRAFALNFHRVNLIGAPRALFSGSNLLDARAMVMFNHYGVDCDYKLVFLHIKHTQITMDDRDEIWPLRLPCLGHLQLLSYESSFTSSPPFEFHSKLGCARKSYQDTAKIQSSLVIHTSDCPISETDDNVSASYRHLRRLFHRQLTRHAFSSEKAVHFRGMDPRLLECLQKELARMMERRRRAYRDLSGLSTVGFDPAAY